jgi:hypothetical protein
MTDLSTTSTVPVSPTPPPSPAPSPAGYSAPPQQSRPGAIPREQYERLPEDQRAGYAQIRGPGGTEFVERAKLEASPADGKPPAPAGEPSVTADGRLRVGDMELSADDVKLLMAEKAQADLRKTTVPASAEDYQAVLPEGFKGLPEGMQWQCCGRRRRGGLRRW